MNTRLVARSIARPVRELLQPWAFNARVLATFAHVCDLATAAGNNDSQLSVMRYAVICHT